MTELEILKEILQLLKAADFMLIIITVVLLVKT
jgi:hypothetical protein